jgi:hypothetical protein
MNQKSNIYFCWIEYIKGKWGKAPTIMKEKGDEDVTIWNKSGKKKV